MDTSTCNSLLLFSPMNITRFEQTKKKKVSYCDLPEGTAIDFQHKLIDTGNSIAFHCTEAAYKAD